MKKDLLDKVIGYYFIIFMFILFGLGILSSYDFLYSDFISNTVVFFGVVGLILYLIYTFMNKSTRKWDLFVILMMFFGYLSYYNAFDKKVALRGFLMGREGMFVIYSYYIFFLLASILKDKKLKNHIVILLTCFGVMQVLYGLFQVLGINNILGIEVVANWKYASGFVFNSNFFGSYTVIMCGLWLAKCFVEENNKLRNFMLLDIFLLGLFMSGAMSAFVALLGMIIFIVIFLLIKKRTMIKEIGKKLLLCIISIFTIYGLLMFGTNSDLNKDINELYNQTLSTAKGEVDESFGTGRIYIWKEAFKYLPEYIYTGIGIDNFAYLGHRDGTYIYDSAKKDNIIYKAHNEYLQVLTTEGIFMFIVYLLFLGTIMILTIKKIFKDKVNDSLIYSFFISFLGYCIQAFFNISMTLIAPIFYMICGLLISCVEEK